MIARIHRRHSMASLKLYDLNASTDQLTFYDDQISDRNLFGKTQDLSVPSRTCFEDLSNELLLNIVEYVSFDDLLHALYDLNQRLNTICELQNLHLDAAGPRRIFHYYCSHQQPMISQIYSLKLSDNYDRLSKFDQCNHIEQFINLRMLSIRDVSPQYLAKILPRLQQLSHLTYLNIDSSAVQSSTMTAAIFQIRSLKRLILDSINHIRVPFDDQSIHPLAELEYLEINSCPVSALLDALRYVGSKIKHLRIRLRYKIGQDMILEDSIMDDHWMSPYPVLASLRRLEMRFHLLSVRQFQFLLRSFPNLTHLTYAVWTSEIDFASSSLWYEFISTHLPNMVKLQFHIRIRGRLENPIECPSTEFIDCFHSMNKNWLAGPVVMDYNSLSRTPVLELYTFPQPAHHGKCDFELYGTKRYMSCSQKDFPVNIDRDITELRMTLNSNQFPSHKMIGSYPKVTRLTIEIQTNVSSAEQDITSKWIISDIIQSIPDLSKITTLAFLTNTSIYPPATLVRHLLDKMPNVKAIHTSYDHLRHLLKFRLICHILHQKIDSLTIVVNEALPKLPALVNIFEIFSLNLRYLTFPFQVNSLTTAFDLVLSLIFGSLYPKLSLLRLSLYSQFSQQPEIFDEQFQQQFQKCLRIKTKQNPARFNSMEYAFRDNVFSVSFSNLD